MNVVYLDNTETDHMFRYCEEELEGADSTGHLLCLPILKHCPPPVPMCPNVMFYLLHDTEGTLDVLIYYLTPPTTWKVPESRRPYLPFSLLLPQSSEQNTS